MKGWILRSFYGDDSWKYLLGICGFGVNICDNLAILIFNEDVYKW